MSHSISTFWTQLNHTKLGNGWRGACYTATPVFHTTNIMISSETLPWRNLETCNRHYFYFVNSLCKIFRLCSLCYSPYIPVVKTTYYLSSLLHLSYLYLRSTMRFFRLVLSCVLFQVVGSMARLYVRLCSIAYLFCYLHAVTSCAWVQPTWSVLLYSWNVVVSDFSATIRYVLPTRLQRANAVIIRF